MSILSFFGKSNRDMIGNSDGAMFRYDLGRTGVARTKPLRNLGSQKWEYQCEAKVTASPCLANNTLFLMSNDGCVHAIDAATGQRKWKFATDTEFGSGESCPAVSDDMLFVTSSDHIYALDVEKGKVRWKFKMRNGGNASPVVYDKLVFFGCLGNFYAADIVKGRIRWSAEIGDDDVTTPAIDTAGRLVLFSGGRHIYAYDVGSGTRKWVYDNRYFMTFPPCVQGGLAFTGVHNRMELKIIEIAEGNVREFTLGAGLWHPVTVTHNRIYAPVLLNVLEAWELSRSRFEVNKAWYFQLEKGAFQTSPVIADEVIYIGSSRCLHAINSATGAELWKHDVGESVVSLPLVHEGAVYFATYSGRVIGLA